MQQALNLARAQLGMVWPNPAVGCVLVKDGRIIAEGATGIGGRPHAESTAVKNAEETTKGVTAYVSLEPCCHWGQTPPCTRTLLDADVSKVVVAVLDADPRMRGQGVQMLRDAGVEVELGLCEDEAKELNSGFFHRITTGRPWVTVVGAQTQLEERTADQDAVLSSRASGLYVSFEYHRRRRSDFRPTDWFLSGASVDTDTMATLGGTELIIVDVDNSGNLRLDESLRALGHRGLTRIVVDAADPIADALQSAGLVQEHTD